MALLKRSSPAQSRLSWASLLLMTGLLASPVRALDATHARLTHILAAHVKAGSVDYAVLKSSPAGLDTYLDELAAVTRTEFDGWSEPQQLAFLLNLYNASTLKLVAGNYPVESIKRIGGLFASPWKLPVVRLWGGTTTLDAVEHDLLRARYKEPRLHFALVCAAKSCPPLRPEAYTGDQLDAQLTDQGRRFLGDPSKNRVETATRTLWLSAIFDWFTGDFTAGGKTLPEFVSPYLGESDRNALASGHYKVRYNDYDWSLNGR